MKKRNLVCLFSALMLFGVNSVSAVDFSKGSKFNVVKNGTANTQGFSYGGYTYNGELKYYTTYNGKQYTAYCEDPANYGGGNYEVFRVLGSNSQQDHINAYDNGILAILSNGYNQFNSSLKLDNGTVVSGDNLYLATSIASRAFTFANHFGKGATQLTGPYKAKASSLVTLAIRWSGMYYGSEGSYSSNYYIRNCKNKSCVEKTIASFYSWYDGKTNLVPAGEGSPSYNVILAAQKLFKMAVKAQSDYANKNTSNFSIVGKINGSEVVGKKETSSTDKKYASIVTIDEDDTVQKQYMYATLDVKNMDGQTGYIKNVRVECPTCSADGITLGAIEYSGDSNNWQELKSDSDISSVLKNENGLKTGKINLRFMYERKITDDCKNTEFELKYDYYNTGNDLKGVILKDPQGNNKQRFFAIAKSLDEGNAPTTGSASGMINCNGGVVCETELQVPICSEDSEKTTAKIKAPEDIKKCILNNKDEAGNSYQSIEENNKGNGEKGVSEDNSYCKIFCKEDYAAIKLNPIIEDVVCGGYFQLKSSIKGSKDCYTASTKVDQSINKEKYIEDITAAQKNMIEGYNLVLKAKAAEAADYEDKSCSGCNGCSQSWYEKSGNYDGIEPGEVNADGVVAVKATEFSYHYGYSGSCKRRSCSTSSDGKRSCHCRGSCSKGSSKSYIKSEIADERKKGENMMKEGMVAYKKAIANLNACTTGWTNNYKFAQKLEFYYDENRYEDVYLTPYYELLDDQAKYLVAKEDTLKETSSITVCTGDINEKYECQVEAVNYDGKLDDKDKYKRDEYNYSSEFDKVFTTKQYTVCDEKGCTGNTRKISTATYIKRTVEKEQDYISPTSFYQIAANGKITVNSGYDGDKLQLAALENALPVSTSTVGGGKFRLMLQGLGEFYDAKDKYGRLIDYTLEEGLTEGSVAYAQNKNGIETTFDGNYKCYYKSSCRPKECPNCEFICDDDVCEWKECPDCKFTCVNCVFNLDELKLNVKTVSTTNFDSVGRTFGYNWITSSSMKALELLNNKASKTISEIKETNEMIYQDDKTSEDSSLAFSVKMTPEVTREILKWNEAAKGKGGYLDSSLTCYDAKIDGQTYKNIYCYSKNIDTLVEKFSDEVTVNKRPKTDAERKNYTKYKESDKGYWTLWDGFLTLNKNEVGSAVKSDADTGETYQVLGGPSWK